MKTTPLIEAAEESVNEFIQEILKFKNNQKMSNEELAGFCDVPLNTLYNFIKGKRGIKLEHAKRISMAIGVQL